MIKQTHPNQNLMVYFGWLKIYIFSIFQNEMSEIPYKVTYRNQLSKTYLNKGNHVIWARYEQKGLFLFKYGLYYENANKRNENNATISRMSVLITAVIRT